MGQGPSNSFLVGLVLSPNQTLQPLYPLGDLHQFAWVRRGRALEPFQARMPPRLYTGSRLFNGYRYELGGAYSTDG